MAPTAATDGHRTRGTALVVWKSAPTEIAIWASRVARVVDASSFEGEVSLDLGHALGASAPAADDAEARVLVLTGKRGPFAVRAVGRLEVQHVTASDRLALPRAFLGARCPFSELVLANGSASLLILDLDELEALTCGGERAPESKDSARAPEGAAPVED